MKYSEFLSKSGQSKNSLGLALKDQSQTVYKALISQISQPSYLEEVTEPESVILLQSVAGIQSPPRYEHYEQFLCSIDGLI